MLIETYRLFYAAQGLVWNSRWAVATVQRNITPLRKRAKDVRESNKRNNI